MQMRRRGVLSLHIVLTMFKYEFSETALIAFGFQVTTSRYADDWYYLTVLQVRGR